MRKFSETIKDFLYDCTDYILILVIIVVISSVIAWRLDILFATEVDKTLVNDMQEMEHKSSQAENSEKQTDENDEQISENATENETTETDDSITSSTEKDNVSDNQIHNETESNQEIKEVITVKIPTGTLPSGIADILVNRGLINNKNEFLDRVQELGLDKKLQSGEFKITKGSSLDNIIKTICRLK